MGSVPDGVSGTFHWHNCHTDAIWPWGWLSL